MDTFGQRIRELRTVHLKKTQKRLSQEAFGGSLGVSRYVIVNLERNLVKPRKEFIDLISKIYQVNKTWLLKGSGPVFSEDSKNNGLDRLVAMFRKLSPDLQMQVLEYVQGLVKLSGEFIEESNLRNSMLVELDGDALIFLQDFIKNAKIDPIAIADVMRYNHATFMARLAVLEKAVRPEL